MKSSLLFCLMALSVYLGACAPSCDRADLTECIRELHIVITLRDLSYGENEAALDVTCQIIEGALECGKEFSRRCMTENEQETYRRMMRGPQSMIDDLCTKGSEFRNEYLRNAECYKNTSEDFRSCYDSFKRKEELLRVSPLSMSSRLRKACCIFNDYKLCTREFLEEKCNTEAADFADQMVNKAGGSLVHTQCAPYSFHPGDC